MKVTEKIENLRKLMAEKNIDAYMIPSADYHNSEYVGEHFKEREFITGFTGSAGTAVITKDRAGLWTDGRYFIQAEKQLQGSGVKLYKMGNVGVPTIEEFLYSSLLENETLGFDGRVVPVQEGKVLENILSKKNIKINYSYDLINSIWEDRPPLSEEAIFDLSLEYAGESVSSKLNRVRDKMRELGANAHIITTLDDIGWLLNIRGNDVKFFPLILSYAIVTLEKVYLYIDERKINDSIKSKLTKNNVELRPYNDVYEDVKKFNEKDSVLIDPDRINYALYNNIPETVKLIEEESPTILMKAIKNDTEIKNIIKAHIKDGIANTKFIYWLKTNVGKIKITELSAMDKLEELRKEQEGYLWQSFSPICGFKEHAAIVHYSPTPETDIEVKPNSLLLTDTGGNYYEGSTDITRTTALGEISDEIKEDFTTVLQCNLRLGKAKFIYGCNGINVDILARQPLWEKNKNFNHGTGHGVGYLGNLHEPPTGIRTKYKKIDSHEFEEGMIITDEPGIYIEGSHGIRIENELLVRKGEVNEYGEFMYFEPITYVPIDLDAVKVNILTEEDKQELNRYHKKVYEIISPYLNDEEREWLKKYTREV